MCRLCAYNPTGGSQTVASHVFWSTMKSYHDAPSFCTTMKSYHDAPRLVPRCLIFPTTTTLLFLQQLFLPIAVCTLVAPTFFSVDCSGPPNADKRRQAAIVFGVDSFQTQFCAGNTQQPTTVSPSVKPTVDLTVFRPCQRDNHCCF